MSWIGRNNQNLFVETKKEMLEWQYYRKKSVETFDAFPVPTYTFTMFAHFYSDT